MMSLYSSPSASSCSNSSGVSPMNPASYKAEERNSRTFLIKTASAEVPSVADLHSAYSSKLTEYLSKILLIQIKALTP